MNYLDFDLELFDHVVHDGSESCRVRVIDAPGGSMKVEDAVRAEFPGSLRSTVRRLSRRELRPEEVVALGTLMSTVLLPGEVGRVFADSLSRLRGREALRIRLRLGTYGLACLPWEYAFWVGPAGEGRFLVLDRRISLVRHEILGDPAPTLDELAPDESVRVGVLLADVDDPRYPSLRLDEEADRISVVLEATGLVDYRVEPIGTRDAFERLITDDPHVWHFAGHGEFVGDLGEKPGTVEGRGRLVLVGEEGAAEPIDAERLAPNLRQRGVRLVVLSACEGASRDATNPWTGVAPALIRAGIPVVVAMQFSIGDEAAIEFAEGFYAALARGAPVDAAVQDGRLAIQTLAGVEDRDWGVPVLYLRDPDRAVVFPRPSRISALKPSRRYATNLLLLGLLVLASATWLYRHLLFPVVPRWAAFAPGLLAFLAFAAGFIRPLLAPFQKEAEDRVGAWLRTKTATRATAASLGVVLLAFVVTSSYHLVYAGNPGGEYRVALIDGSDTTEALLQSDGEALSRLTFFKWPLRDYEFVVTSPRLYESREPAGFPVWNTVNLAVPTDFAYRRAPLAILIPDLSVSAWGVAPPETAAPARRVDLVLTRDARSDTLRDIRFQSLLLATDSVFTALASSSEAAESEGQTHDEIFAGMSESQRAQWLQLLRSRRIWTTDVFGPGKLDMEFVNAESGGVIEQLSIEIVQHSPPRADVYRIGSARSQ